MSSTARTPFIKRFTTDRGFYIYDVNTNRILIVDRPIYDILGDYGKLTHDEIRQRYIPVHGESAVEQAFSEIEAARRDQNLFCSDRPKILTNGLSPEEFQRAYTTLLRQMILEVTQQCNLRCHYCAYGGTYNNVRTHSTKHMSVKTAFEAIDFLHAHSGEAESHALSFYGGEPLLEFDLIKKCVAYAHSIFGRGGVRFNLTTNGTLIDKEKAAFFAENKFSILVSIDGPQRVHDNHRVDLKGHGSYTAAVNGLQTLYEAYSACGEVEGKVMINMVVTPPYDLDALNDLWVEQPWLPKTVEVIVDYIDPLGTSFFAEYPCNELREVHVHTRERALQTFTRTVLCGEPRRSPVARALFEPGLVRMYKRRVYVPREIYPPNGCCIPGVRKVYVTCDGNLYLCEKVHGSPILGSVYTGYDLNVMMNVVDTYAQESIRDCSECWAVNLCGVCFARAFFDGKIHIEKKRIACRMEQKSLVERLQIYSRILEQDQHAFDYMEAIKLS